MSSQRLKSWCSSNTTCRGSSVAQRCVNPTMSAKSTVTLACSLAICVTSWCVRRARRPPPPMPTPHGSTPSAPSRRVVATLPPSPPLPSPPLPWLLPCAGLLRPLVGPGELDPESDEPFLACTAPTAAIRSSTASPALLRAAACVAARTLGSLLPRSTLSRSWHKLLTTSPSSSSSCSCGCAVSGSASGRASCSSLACAAARPWSAAVRLTAALAPASVPEPPPASSSSIASSSPSRSYSPPSSKFWPPQPPRACPVSCSSTSSSSSMSIVSSRSSVSSSSSVVAASPAAPLALLTN
mmetsp:Transcript_14609/g.42747  ORF Transcript_14609/g.42747 Transcript_14609/m.42747 type:complete len:297 (-) Transcript_14609:335-1225(-)